MENFSKTVTVLAFFAFVLSTANLAYATSGPNINLPSGEVTVKVDYPSSECYYYVILNNIPEGYHVSNGQFLGWCVDEHNYISNGKTYSATLYSSYASNNPHPDDDWDKVNYILNHKQGSWNDVQAAIWYFIDGGIMPSSDDGKAMVSNANAFGEGFVPAPGEKMAVVVWINSNTQVPIIEVCVPIQNTVPEYPLGPILGTASFFAALEVYRRKHS
jgi:hypothetical protein